MTEQAENILHFVHGLFYDTEEVKEYIDFSQNEALRKEITKMSLTGEHLVELGREQEKEKTRIAEQKLEEVQKKFEAEKQKAEAEKQKVEAEKQKAEAAELEIQKLREELEQLRNKMNK